VKNEFYNKNDIVLFKGTGSNKNDMGIILCVDNSKQNLVAMGDVSYACAQSLPKCLISRRKSFEKIDYLVVPHHGAQVRGSLSFSPKVPITSSGHSTYPSDAIISVGYNPKTTYNHPRQNTIVDLHNKKFRIIRTDKDGRQFIKF